MFKLTRDPHTGKLEWSLLHNNADDSEDTVGGLESEIALSSYGDMLHDEDRNNKYAEAISKAVRSLKDRKDGKSKVSIKVFFIRVKSVVLIRFFL